jgi:hypothetical protein
MGCPRRWRRRAALFATAITEAPKLEYPAWGEGFYVGNKSDREKMRFFTGDQKTHWKR